MRVNFTICRKRYCIATRICHAVGRVCTDTSSFRYGARSLNPTINLWNECGRARGKARATACFCVYYFLSSFACSVPVINVQWLGKWTAFFEAPWHYLFLSAGCYRCSALHSAQVVSFPPHIVWMCACTFLCAVVLPTLLLITLCACVWVQLCKIELFSVAASHLSFKNHAIPTHFK